MNVTFLETSGSKEVNAALKTKITVDPLFSFWAPLISLRGPLIHLIFSSSVCQHVWHFLETPGSKEYNPAHENHLGPY